MQNKLLQDNLKIEPAIEKDWLEILQLLEENDLTFWFTGNVSSENFYIAKDPKNKKIICCFSIEFEDTIGILKSFAISKGLQGKGIGKHIVNNNLERLSQRLGIKKLYAASIEAPEFWAKTIFKEIKRSEIKDDYFFKYLDNFCDKVSNYFEKTHYFLLTLTVQPM